MDFGNDQILSDYLTADFRDPNRSSTRVDCSSEDRSLTRFTAALRHKLGPEHTYEFLDASFECEPAPGMKHVAPTLPITLPTSEWTQ